MSRVILLVGAALAAALAVVTALFGLGVYNIAATEQHTRPVYLMLEAGMRQSVRFHARDVVVPTLSDTALAHRGRVLYDAHCVRCHGAPGVAPESFALGMTPPPANLAYAAREWPPRELFWVVKYGIKMTGMPAWQFRFDDNDLWSIVAYLQLMPYESPRQYATARPQSAATVSRADPKEGGDPHRGIVALRQYGCATCHDIPGVIGADAHVGPPLGGIATRRFLAGVVPNDHRDLVAWIRTPQELHPGDAMPDLGVSERDANDMAAYLYTLR